jgi:transcriptional regulator with XRE-family HTH domain
MTRDEQLELARRMAAETSQAEVARRCGVSDAVVCGVLKGKYNETGTIRFLSTVEEEYGTSTVRCPGTGEEIPLSDCAANRRRHFHQAAVNPFDLALWKTCRICPQNQKQPIRTTGEST